MTRARLIPTFILFAALYILPNSLFGSLFEVYYLKRSGPYVSAMGSYDWFSRMTTTSTLKGQSGGTITDTSTVEKHFRPKASWNAVSALGYCFNHWRLEIEGTYRHVRENLSLDQTVAIGGSTGTLNISRVSCVPNWAVMGNAFFDLPLGCSDKFLAYVGGGVGVGFTKTKAKGVIAGNTVHFKERNSRFAFQVMAGLSYAISPCWHLQGGYRFFGMHRFSRIEDKTLGSGTDVALLSLGLDRTPLIHALELGIRKMF